MGNKATTPALVSPRWLATYLAQGLGCDTPILEAIWCNPQLNPWTLEEIWRHLAQTDHGDLVRSDEPDLDVMQATLERAGWQWGKRQESQNVSFGDPAVEWTAWTRYGSQLVVRWKRVKSAGRVTYRVHQHQRGAEERTVEYQFFNRGFARVQQCRSLLWLALAEETELDLL